MVGEWQPWLQVSPPDVAVARGSKGAISFCVTLEVETYFAVDLFWSLPDQKWVTGLPLNFVIGQENGNAAVDLCQSGLTPRPGFADCLLNHVYGVRWGWEQFNTWIKSGLCQPGKGEK